MGPERTQKSAAFKRNAKAGPSSSPATVKPVPIDQRDGSGIPGVSKLKASIRQTTRLLAKDSLEPGFRVATERRLASLQTDLKNAEKRGVEKKNGSKYHQVKFFERQKLQRIIKRLNKSIAEASGKSRTELEMELEEARVMLNYVRHYPNTQKYISLFPSSEEQPISENLSLPPLFAKNPDPADRSAVRRRQLLDQFRTAMQKGDMRVDVENEKEGTGRRTANVVPSIGGAMRGEDKKVHVADKKSKVKDEEEDDFFQSGSDDEE